MGGSQSAFTEKELEDYQVSFRDRRDAVSTATVPVAQPLALTTATGEVWLWGLVTPDASDQVTGLLTQSVTHSLVSVNATHWLSASATHPLPVGEWQCHAHGWLGLTLSLIVAFTLKIAF